MGVALRHFDSAFHSLALCKDSLEVVQCFEAFVGRCMGTIVGFVGKTFVGVWGLSQDLYEAQCYSCFEISFSVSWLLCVAQWQLRNEQVRGQVSNVA